MNHQEHIKKFKAIWEAHGQFLSEEEAAEQFYRLYACMRLILRKESEKRKQRYNTLIKEQIGDIISH